MRKRILALVCFSLPLTVMATPDYIEFIFLSQDNISFLNQTIERIENQDNRLFSLVVQSSAYNCVPMGEEGCFHPQLGLIQQSGINNDKVIQKKSTKDNKLKTFNAIENNMIDCKSDYYFDIFCGKEKGKIKPAPMEIWIDTSSSMRKMDYSKDQSQCKRRKFASSVVNGCGVGKISISTFNTARQIVSTENTGNSIKESLSSLCNNYGMNDTKRMIDWVRGSSAKYLMVITDIDELNIELSNFLISIGAKTYGTEVKDFTISDLQSRVGSVVSRCKK